MRDAVRFATQPLRNWISQLQQKQLRAALKLEFLISEFGMRTIAPPFSENLISSLNKPELISVN
jgi:hypothetical protein